ncbi:MAG TPA: hypothetical protein VNI20_11205 [Fimbriimonadaceae bacterium]|nr:hypothetical protein [Fimbriimonadaceae bacterium]
MKFLLKYAVMAVSVIGSLFASIEAPKPAATLQAPASTKMVVRPAARVLQPTAVRRITVILPAQVKTRAPADDTTLSRLLPKTYNVKAIQKEAPWFLRLDSLSLEPLTQNFDIFATGGMPNVQ